MNAKVQSRSDATEMLLSSLSDILQFVDFNITNIQDGDTNNSAGSLDVQVNKNELKLLKLKLKTRQNGNICNKRDTDGRADSSGIKKSPYSVVLSAHLCQPSIRLVDGMPILLDQLGQAVSLIHYARCSNRRFSVPTRIPEPEYYLPCGAIRCGERHTVSLMNPTVYRTNEVYKRPHFVPTRDRIETHPFIPPERKIFVTHKTIKSWDEASSLMHWVRCCEKRLKTKTRIPRPIFELPFGTRRFAERQTVLAEKPNVLKFSDDYKREDYLPYSTYIALQQAVVSIYGLRKAIVSGCGTSNGFKGRNFLPTGQEKKPLMSIKELDSEGEANSKEEVTVKSAIENLSAKEHKSSMATHGPQRSMSVASSGPIRNSIYADIPIDNHGMFEKSSKSATTKISSKNGKLVDEVLVDEVVPVVKRSKFLPCISISRNVRYTKHAPLPPIPRGRRLNDEAARGKSPGQH